jgi:serine phosphatase RsbU (regulator of sigma subunit)
MALFRSLIRIFSGQTSLEGLVLPGNNASDDPIGSGSDGAPISSPQINALEAVQLTNNYIIQNHGDLAMFATLFFGVLDPSTGLLTYINGGHEPLLVIDASGGVKRNLNPTGPAVGIIPDTVFEIRQTHLQPGDTLLGYTDGMLEALAESGEFSARKRLFTMLEQSVPSATALLDQVVAKATGHMGENHQHDDITILAVRREADDS